MKKISRLILLGIFTAFICSNLYSNPNFTFSENDLSHSESANILFVRAITGIWAGTSTPKASLSLLDQSAEQFAKLQNTAAREYFLAQVELYRGRVILNANDKVRAKDKASAREYFDKAMKLAESSIERIETADAYRVLADAGSSWMITKGLGGIISMAPKVQDWSDKALSLDPDNALALLISAQGQINAPKSAGGNPQEALNRLNRQYKRSDLSDIERFWTLVSLAQAYKKLRQNDEAEKRCVEAGRIFPMSPLLENCPG